jgi:hypothetical protein
MCESNCSPSVGSGRRSCRVTSRSCVASAHAFSRDRPSPKAVSQQERNSSMRPSEISIQPEWPAQTQLRRRQRLTSPFWDRPQVSPRRRRCQAMRPRRQISARRATSCSLSVRVPSGAPVRAHVRKKRRSRGEIEQFLFALRIRTHTSPKSLMSHKACGSGLMGIGENVDATRRNSNPCLPNKVQTSLLGALKPAAPHQQSHHRNVACFSAKRKAKNIVTTSNNTIGAAINIIGYCVLEK